MTAPFTFTSGTASSGTSFTVNVTSSTTAGDALVVSVSFGGTTPPTMAATGLTDSQGNTWTLTQSFTGATPYLYVFTALGATNALSSSTPDTLTVTTNSGTITTAGVIGTDCPGVTTIDVNVVNSGSTNTLQPTVSGTVGQTGETALALFAWGNSGGATPSGGNSISSPFTQQTQIHTGASSTYQTTAYDTSPPTGSLVAAATIGGANTNWRVVILTLEPAAVAHAGPPFYPAVQPIRSRIPLTGHGKEGGGGAGGVSAGRVYGVSSGGPVLNPAAPAMFPFVPGIATPGAAQPGDPIGGPAGSSSVVNQWAATFSQPSSFQTTPPALQSVVIALDNATSVGGGSGTPTPGNWLFCLTAMNETYTTSMFTVGVADDIHSYWRVGQVSTASALTRTSIWYTPNIAAVPQYVYVAPEGAFDAMAVLVVEVSGIGPWDTVTATASSYAAAARAVTLNPGVPANSSFVIAAVAGDKDNVSQAFAPAGWTALSTVTATNGTDHTCDSVLTSAILPSNMAGFTVSGTTSGNADLSGALVEVQIGAPSPIPAGQNQNWPYVKFEAAFGAGFQTPADEMAWTDLTPRCWSWDETTGIQYQLGQIQATELDLELDNSDNMLSIDNPAAYFYTQATPAWAPQAAFYDAQVAASSPLAWWKLSDASGASSAADSSGNSHPATATSVTFAETNEAVTSNTTALFNGTSSHCLSTYNPALSAVTVEAWVNLDGLTQSGNPRFVANSHTDVDNSGFQLMFDGSGPVPTPHVWFGTGTANANARATAGLPGTGWTYLAATWDGTTILLYVNGIPVATAALSGTLSAGTASGIGLGYNPAYSGDYFHGLLGECAVYGDALPAAEIAAHWTAGPAATGTPVRLRAAIGTLGGVVSNRWYVIQRNAEMWPQQITQGIWRRYAPVTATDIWSALAASDPTPYRGEVAQDNPYAYWPMNDQPLPSGVQPTTLLNAAPGNLNVLNIAVSPNGAGIQDVYASRVDAGTGVRDDITTHLQNDGYSYAGKDGLPKTIGSYMVAQSSGWLFGDPLASQDSYQTTNPVTSSPGSAAVQFSGQAGSSGSYGWWAYCHDAGFPPLNAGVTIEGWFNYAFLGGASGIRYANGLGSDINTPFAEQPISNLTLWEIATGSAEIAVLQLNTSGALTFLGNSIWSTTDLRDNSWHHYAVTLTTSTYTVYVDGGLTATSTGSAGGLTSSWSWLILNGDLGANGGSTAGTGLECGGNVQIAHVAVYPSVLPAWRILAHYCAGITGFGVLPAPATPQITVASWVPNPASLPGQLTFSVDGTTAGGYATGSGNPPNGYGSQGSAPGPFKPLQYVFSAVVTAAAGNYHSGPSARVTQTGIGTANSGSTVGTQVLYIAWTGVSAEFYIYTANSAGAELQAEQVASANDTLVGGYGGGTSSDTGVGHVASGDGSAVPSGPSSLGDTVGQRLERILGYGLLTTTARAIDPAPLLVQAANDIGGQSTGQNLGNIQQSDGGMLYIDNLGVLTYWQKSHLASQYGTPVWTVGPANTPYYEEIEWTGDPQRVWNSIQMMPFSPDESTLPTIGPAQYQQVLASMQQYGAQPFQITNYLQSSTEMQSYANWLLEMYGILRIRAQNVKIDAAPYPAAFQTVLGINVGDVVQAQMWQVGGGGAMETLRVNQIRRRISFAGQDGQVEASIELQLSWEPPSYWS